MKTRQKAFTIVELLVVIGIISVLVGLIMPAIGVARIQARKAQMRATLHALSMGLEQFRDEFGSYPQSSTRRDPADSECALAVTNLDNVKVGQYQRGNGVDSGAQRLVEAMVGIDLLGYCQQEWYQLDKNTGEPIDGNGNLIKRANLYIDPENAEIKNFRTIYGKSGQSAVDDEFDKMQVNQSETYENMNPLFVDIFSPQEFRPILYYKAAPSGNLIHDTYFYSDNEYLLNHLSDSYVDPDNDGRTLDFTSWEIAPDGYDEATFERFVWDTDTSADAREPMARACNRDSFLLISAGPDHIFGTEDDICNFDVNWDNVWENDS